MQRIRRPNPHGKFAPIAPAFTIAAVGFSVWWAFRTYDLGDATQWPAANIAFAALFIGAVALGVYRQTRPHPNGVDIGRDELVVTSGENVTHIPLAEASVRRPTSQQLFIDHDRGSTEVDIVGILPAHVEIYVNDLEQAIANGRKALE